VSIFQGHLSAENIFIQSSGVIKVAPTLLALTGICEFDHGNIRASLEKKKFNLERISLTNKLLVKDVHAIGRLAIEIFTAHLKLKTPTSPTLKMTIFDSLTSSVNLDETEFCVRNMHLVQEISDEMQKDFIVKCLNANEKTDFESIWSHPLINEIYSLKVLSVFCILTYFHDKKKSKSVAIEKSTSPSLRNSTNTLNNIPKILIENANSDENAEVFYSGQAVKKTTDSEYLRISLKQSPLSNHLKHRKFSLNMHNYSSSPPKPPHMLTQNGNNHVKLMKSGNDKRKVSLTFLTGYNDLKIPHHFFSILEDIRTGLYPRLFKEIDSSDLNLDSFSSSTCLDFVIQQKNLIDNIDRRASAPFLITRNNSDSNIKGSSNHGQSPSNRPLELRRLAAEDCSIKKVSGNMIELRLNLKFQDEVFRTLCSYFPEDFLNYLKDNQNMMVSESINLSFLKNPIDFDCTTSYDERSIEEKILNISIHLSNELIDFGLINSLDHNLISDLFSKTIKDYLLSLMPNKPF